MGKPHKHAELIKAFIEGTDIEVNSRLTPDSWELVKHLSAFDSGFSYEFRIKPERVWPVTSMTSKELSTLIYYNASLKDIANTAIKRYIEDNEK